MLVLLQGSHLIVGTTVDHAALQCSAYRRGYAIDEPVHAHMVRSFTLHSHQHALTKTVEEEGTFT